MTHSPLRILWGPYNHQVRDRWLQFSLRHTRNIHFGPFGADLIYRPDLGQADLFARADAVKPDLVIVLDPHLRLIGPELLTAPCPLVVCAGKYPFDAEQWGLFDGLIPLEWRPDESIQRHMPVAPPLTDWMPSPSESFRYPKPRVHPLVCLADHVSSELWRALEKLDTPVLYLNAQERLEQHRLCSQSQVVLIPDNQPAAAVFEAWHAGARLLLSENMAAALEPLLQKGRDFICFDPDNLDTAFAQALQLPGHPLAFPWQHTLPKALQTLWPDLQARCQQRLQNTPRVELLHSMWSMSPVQFEALPWFNTDQPWLKAALEPNSPAPTALPQTAAAQLCVARRLLHQGETGTARAQLEPLLNQSPPPHGEAFPMPRGRNTAGITPRFGAWPCSAHGWRRSPRIFQPLSTTPPLRRPSTPAWPNASRVIPTLF